MFVNFYYGLIEEGIPVTFYEWMTLMDALAKGLACSSLSGFYQLARAVLVKNEAHFDRYDLAFAKTFNGVETGEDLLNLVLEWLKDPLPPLELPPGERHPLARWELDELRRQLEERLRTQDGRHHGGRYWIGTGGTSPLGHSGIHSAGLRMGGASINRSAVKVAEEREYRDFRDDKITGVRQYEVALRKLRQFSTRSDGPKSELDLDGTIDATCRNGGALKLAWTRPRRNMMKVVLLMDSGGSMNPYTRICSRLFTAANHSTHFKELKFYYFHNCIYDRIYNSPILVNRNAVKTLDFLRNLNSDYRLILVGDASMGLSELTLPGGAIDWGQENDEPGLVWLERLLSHFPYSVWLNPIPKVEWETAEGAPSIQMVRRLFPMFELTPEGLEQAVKKLKTRR